MGLGARDSALISNLGEGEKHLNWTPDVALQHAGIRSGLVLNLLLPQPYLRGSPCWNFSAFPPSEGALEPCAVGTQDRVCS